MKHFLHLLIFLIPAFTFAQPTVPIDKKTGHVLYTGVIDAKGVSQPELYLRMKAFYNTYSAGENAMKLETDEPGRLSAKTFTDVIVDDGTTTERQRLWYTLSLDLEDGRFIYEMRNFSLQRHCIPARQIPCEAQTKTIAVEALISPVKKGKKNKTSTNPYSLENALEKATSSLLAAMQSSALSERRIAGIKPE